MPLSHFRQAPKLAAHLRNVVQPGPYPERLDALFSHQMTRDALAEISQWPGYAPTPLRSLDKLAGALGLGEVLYKDESQRFGLGSFKALGGSYAVLRLLSDKLGVSMAELRSGAARDAAAQITVTTATDGNHGRSVAWGAQQAGCKCRIYVHKDVSENRAAAMTELGAELVRTTGTYDDAVRQCAAESAQNGWFVVSDTSYEGYLNVPRQVMAGYTALASEVMEQAPAPITHIFLQAGVGGMAAAVAARYWMEHGAALPRIVIVESEYAACFLKSAKQGRAAKVRIRHETVMAGMSCGEVSVVAWEILRRTAGHFVTIADSTVAPAMRMLASGVAGGGEIEAGECSVAGPVALIAAACDQNLRESMQLDNESRVLLIGTEGATDRAIYDDLLKAV